MLTWGLVAAAMMFVRTPAHFYGAAVVLGMAEAGFFPGVIYYLSQWFPQEMRSRAISRFYMALPLATWRWGWWRGVLLRLNGRLGLKGWQWLFLLEALPAVVLAGVVWTMLPDGPETARGWMRASGRGCWGGWRRMVRGRVAGDRIKGGAAGGAGVADRGVFLCA